MTAQPEQEARLEWLKQRQTGVGGSDAAPIVQGADQYGKTISDIYDEKTALTIVDDAEPSKPILRGRYLEPIAADEFVRVTGRKIRRQPMKRHRQHPHSIANIDRQQVSDPRGPGVLEIKAPGWKVFSNIKENGKEQWYHFNDTSVKEVHDLSTIKTPHAYCFFYCKKK